MKKYLFIVMLLIVILASSCNTNKTKYEHPIEKDKEYVEKNDNQFADKDNHYIISGSDTEKSNDKVEAKTVNESLFYSFIGKDKEYVKKNANQFTEKYGHYIIYYSDTDELNDWVEVIFNTKNESEFLVWNSGKHLDQSKSFDDFFDTTYLASQKLGLPDIYEAQKEGSFIGNHMVTIYKDDVMCLYDYNDEFFLKCGLSTSFSESEVQLADNIWGLFYYVDVFGIPGDEPYIINYQDIIGTFNNSVYSKKELRVDVLVDKYSISFKLYEYGSFLVRNNSSSYTDVYKIIMLDSQNHKFALEGNMDANSNKIRINFIPYQQVVLEALLQNGSVSFYIENMDYPATNYLFTIPSNNGFPTAYQLLQETNYLFDNDGQEEKSNELSQTSTPTEQPIENEELNKTTDKFSSLEDSCNYYFNQYRNIAIDYDSEVIIDNEQYSINDNMCAANIKNKSYNGMILLIANDNYDIPKIRIDVNSVRKYDIMGPLVNWMAAGLNTMDNTLNKKSSTNIVLALIANNTESYIRRNISASLFYNEDPVRYSLVIMNPEKLGYYK